MIMRLCVSCLLFVVLDQAAQAAQILAYFPLPSKSHHIQLLPILKALGKRGHVIDYYTPFPSGNEYPNITEIPVENFIEILLGKDTETPLAEQSKRSFSAQIQRYFSVNEHLSEALCHSNAIRHLLESKMRYDLLIHEGIYFMEVGQIFAHKFGVPSVTILPIGDVFTINEYGGMWTNPSYMPGGLVTYTDRMSFLQRVHNTYALAVSTYKHYVLVANLQKIVDKCYTYPGWERRPSLFTLLSDQALILVNSHHSIAYPVPRPPHVKEIGGTIMSPSNHLPQDLASFVNDAKDGVIYLSFGTIVDMKEMMPHLREKFEKAFNKRKERVLWKWNGDSWDGLSNHIMLSKWFPQQDVLAHKNIRLFITHGGLQSTFESVNFGVPVIVIPCFGDQGRNAACLSQAGYGVHLDIDNVSESSLDWALTETLDNPRYKERVMKGSTLLKDRPIKPIDEAIYWIEYVLRNGNALQPAGAKFSFVQFYCLDVFAFMFTILSFVFISLWCIIRWIKNAIITFKVKVS